MRALPSSWCAHWYVRYLKKKNRWLLDLVFNTRSTQSLASYWHQIYFFCKTSSSNMEGRIKPARHKFQRWKWRVFCLRSNANAPISSVQRLPFLHIEPEDRISLLLLQFDSRKCWLQGRQAAAKRCREIFMRFSSTWQGDISKTALGQQWLTWRWS